MKERAAAQWPFLCVMSAGVDLAVQFVGGLIFDRVREGRRVTVLVPAAEDAGALQILGADVADIGNPPAQLRECRTALAASAMMFAQGVSTCAEVKTALATKTTEVILWGPALPVELERGSRQITYRLGRAASVFKAQAMTSAGLDPILILPTEIFVTTCARSVIASDLNVAG